MKRKAGIRPAAGKPAYFRAATFALLSLVLLCTAAYAVTVAWTRTVTGGPDRYESGRAAAIAPNNDVYVVGQIAAAGQDSNIWIRKYSPAGASRWTRTVDGPASSEDLASGVTVDDSGNLYVVGYVHVGGESANIWVRKYSPTGTEKWTRTVNGPANSSDFANGVTVDSAGNIYVVGSVTVPGQQWNIWVRKYSPSGAKLWTRTVDGPASGDDTAYAAAVDNADNLFVVGAVYVPGQERNIWVRKYSSSGAKLWTRTVDGPIHRSDTAFGAAVDGAGNLYVVGEVARDDFDEDIWIRKYSGSGSKLWTRTVSGSAMHQDSLRAATVDASGALYVTGWMRELTITGGCEAVVWTSKYSSSGQTLWTQTAEGPVDFAAGDGIAVDTTGGVYVTGSIFGHRGYFDIWIRKYAP